MRSSVCVLFVLLALAGAAAIADQNCQVARGTRVTLFGGVDDPDVLVWDSQDRLVKFSAGSADARQFLLPHALLNRPGTRAVVVTCRSGVVHPKFSSDQADAIGVMIVSGKYRGRYGWVSSTDLHGPGIREAQTQW